LPAAEYYQKGQKKEKEKKWFKEKEQKFKTTLCKHYMEGGDQVCPLKEFC
jgi:hypothetical protein